VTDKGDGHIPGRGFDGIRGKLFLGSGGERARQDEEHYQGKYSTHDQTSLPMRLWELSSLQKELLLLDGWQNITAAAANKKALDCMLFLLISWSWPCTNVTEPV